MLRSSLLLSGAVCALTSFSSFAAIAQTVTPAASAFASPSPSATPASAATTSIVLSPTPTPTPPVILNINGQVVESNPAPIVQNGAVLVPLRGVLENLGAKLNYNATSRGITIEQGGKRVLLVINSRDAIVGTSTVQLSAAPQIIGGSTFVPLRSLAELFGFSVQWTSSTRTVAIGATGGVAPSANHRAVLAKAGNLGVQINFVEGEGTVSAADALRLLDAAKNAGASLIKVRFDWGVLEPTKGADFAWPFYDTLISEARKRGLVVTGVLGQSSKWASTFYKSTNPELWRNGAPRTSEYAAWSNYVRRVVGRYKNDVHAWQVWEKTSPERFRSSQTAYRKLLAVASRAVRASDKNAILYAAESGGLDLDVIEADVKSEASPLLDGVTIFPTSQNQPGSVAPLGNFLRPLASLRLDRELNPTGQRDFWVGGLSRPVLRDGAMVGEIAADDADLRARILSSFTPEAQAAYLVQTSTLALASGAPKVFWEQLRDEAAYESVAPVNPEYNNGLLRRDFSPRPSFEAFKNLSSQMNGKKFVGSLALGPDIVALLFDGGQDATVVAWSMSAGAQLVVNGTGVNPAVLNSLYVSTRPDSEVLDMAGKVIFGADGILPLTSQPLFVTNVAFETRNAAAKPAARGLLLTSSTQSNSFDAGVSASFSQAGNESGISWRRFLNFRGAANKFEDIDGRSGLTTEISRNVLDPAAGKFFIFLDVDDDYLYFTHNIPVEVTVEVKRPARQNSSIVNATAGFNIEYSSATGTGRTSWQNVEEGEGWATYIFTLPDASFSNRSGYDLTINTFGSKRNLAFGAISVRRK